jgi:hypothetical protein
MLSIVYDKKISKEVKKSIQIYLNNNFPAIERYNALYNHNKLLDVITYLTANDYFVEEVSGLLRLRGIKLPTAYTVFYRIKPATVAVR